MFSRATLANVLLSLVLASPATASYKCTDFDVPMSFEARSFEPSFPPFKNHYQAVALLGKLTARNSAQSPPPFRGVNNNTAVNVTIAAQYCAPTETAACKTLQVLSHGLGFDHTYWSFGGAKSQYNYVKAAAEAGYATLSYDRIGNGNSSKPDPYTINQLPIETEVLAVLTAHLRRWDIPALAHAPRPSKIVHVGHSYGSFISDALVAANPELSDGVVLTGYSGVPSSPGFLISTNFHLARQDRPKRFSHLSTGYLTWGDELANQFAFFYYPHFSPLVLAAAELAKWPFSIGELLTANQTAAPDFAGPVLVLSGQYDQIFCQSDCTGLLEKAAPLFPKASPFQTYIQPNTGHGINLHYNASGAYDVINAFITKNVQQ